MLPRTVSPAADRDSGANLFRVVSHLRRVLRRTILQGLPFAPLSPSAQSIFAKKSAAPASTPARACANPAASYTCRARAFCSPDENPPEH